MPLLRQGLLAQEKCRQRRCLTELSYWRTGASVLFELCLSPSKLIRMERSAVWSQRLTTFACIGSAMHFLFDESERIFTELE